MGRFDDSIAQYRKALAIDPNFVNAYQGIAMALLYQGKPEEAAGGARATSRRRPGPTASAARACSPRRSCTSTAARRRRRCASVDEQYALGEKTNDVGAMAFDSGLKGNMLLDMGKPDQAKKEFERGVAARPGLRISPRRSRPTTGSSSTSISARVALAKKDLAAAKAEAEEFRTGAATSKNPLPGEQAHELDGIIALAREGLGRRRSPSSQQANLQNPQNLYRLCQAYQGKGDAAKAAEFCKQAADFNSLPNLNYAFVRTKARTS